MGKTNFPTKICSSTPILEFNKKLYSWIAQGCPHLHGYRITFLYPSPKKSYEQGKLLDNKFVLGALLHLTFADNLTLH